MTDVLTGSVDRAPQRNGTLFRSASPVLAYGFGCVTGGICIGLAFAASAILARELTGTTSVVVAAAIVGSLAIVLQWFGRMGLLPQRRRQVPRRWLLSPHRSFTAFRFGVLLGAGVVTYLQFPVLYVLGIAAALTFDPVAGAVIGAAYGGSRSASVFAAWSSQLRRSRKPSFQWLFDHRTVVNRVLALAGAAVLIAVLATSF